MKRMRLISHYSNYGSGEMWDASSPVKCVCDSVYEFMLGHYNEYEYVFTHDTILLNALPNAKPILWGNVWCRSENPKKTKLMSMTSSDKALCDLHKERMRIARKYKDKIDVYGTIDGGEFADPIDTLEPYMYSVVIENYIDNLWFTEKICNCFATKTIPIYYGARDIGDYFNTDGIIICESIEDLEKNIDAILNDEYAGDFYINCRDTGVLQDNFNRVKQYEKFDKWLYNTYKKEIEGLFE